MRSRSLVPALAVLLLLLPGAAVAQGAAGPAGDTPPGATLTMSINACGFEGKAGGIPGNRLTIRLRSAGGALRQKATVPLNGVEWGMPCTGVRVRGGDRVEIAIAGQATPFRVFRVPRLRLQIDRIGDRVRGNAPGGADLVILSAFHCSPGLSPCKGEDTPIAPAPGTGAFSEPAILDGSSQVELDWQKGSDEVVLRQVAPRLVVRPGSPTVSGDGGAPGQHVVLRLRRGATVTRTEVTTGPDAAFRGTFRKGGRPVRVRPGDVVTASIASDATMTVPVTRLVLGDAGVSGRCFPDSNVLLREIGRSPSFFRETETDTDADGRWSVPTVTPPGATATAFCGDAAGDVVVASKRAS